MLLREWFVTTFTQLVVVTTSMLVTNNCCCTVQVLGTNTQLSWKTRKKHRSKVVADEKRKLLSDEVSELKVKRRALRTDAEALSASLQTDAVALSASADDFADQAEKLQKLPLLAKANGMRRAAREKEDYYY